MTKRNPRDFINDIIQNASLAQRFISNQTFEDFSKDEKTYYAVIRALEVIGEATRNIPQEIINKYPFVPWQEIRGFRNRVIHEYFGIDKEIVWDTIQEDVPELIKAFSQILVDLDKQ